MYISGYSTVEVKDCEMYHFEKKYGMRKEYEEIGPVFFLNQLVNATFENIDFTNVNNRVM
jgi:hypothetical protein